jgi:hypothetical protein
MKWGQTLKVSALKTFELGDKVVVKDVAGIY